jgi:hypothetical protein
MFYFLNGEYISECYTTYKMSQHLHFCFLCINLSTLFFYIKHYHAWYQLPYFTPQIWQTRNLAFIQLIMMRMENYNINDICNVNTINMVLGCCLTWQECHPMAWMVSHWPLTTKAKVQSQASLCGIYVVKVQLRQVFLKLSSHQYHSTNAPYSFIYLSLTQYKLSNSQCC